MCYIWPIQKVMETLSNSMHVGPDLDIQNPCIDQYLLN